MKRTKIILSVLIAAILLFAGITANAGDNAEPKEDSKRLHELEGQRTLSSRAYAMSDGTVQHELFATDIHYKNNAGKVVPIDIKVKDIDGAKNQGYKYKNGENSWNVYFADKGKAQEMVKIEQDDYAISFSMNNSKSDAVASKAINMERGKSTFHDMYAEDPTVVIYQDAMPDIDVAYTIREHSIKEDIVFNKKPTTNEFTFDITTKNLNVVLKEDRLLYNDAKSGEQVFTSANLYMEDSKG
ncbi:MAG: hypothetical protein KAQ68_10205, partial [Clostridiales bacterium]|nr:hypothetical protein [Clostridiales bacterium]